MKFASTHGAPAPFHSGLLLLGLAGLGIAWPGVARCAAQSAETGPTPVSDLSVVLLGNPQIQKELNLTKAQIAETVEPAEKLGGELVTLSFNPENRGHPEKVQAGLKKLKAREKELLGHLDPGQQQRLQELYYQSLGIRVFQSPPVQKILQLTDDQQQEIRQITGSLSKELQALFSEFRKSGSDLPSPATRQANREKADRLLQQATEAVNRTLTGRQREQLKEMKGKPFPMYAERQQ